MRIMAFVLIVLSALCFGLELNKNQRRRMEQLYSLISFTDYILAELTVRPCCMDELCKKAMEACSNSIQSFLQVLHSSLANLTGESFCRIWHQSCHELTYINEQQRKIITSLGERLGNFELSTQLKAIESCKADLNNEYIKMKSEYSNNSKLCIALPCTVACMILVILI